MSLSSSGARRAPRRRTPLVLVGALLALIVAVPGVAAGGPEVGPTLDPDALPPIEVYVVNLINCNRAGGLVTSSGSCVGRGDYAKPVREITLNWFTSRNVARPYAKILAVRNLCGHNYWGDPGWRFRRVGYRPARWGENVGCHNNPSTYAAALSQHRAMQAERSYNGGHWRNIRNPYYRWVGVGVYRYSGRVRVVTDFYNFS